VVEGLAADTAGVRMGFCDPIECRCKGRFRDNLGPLVVEVGVVGRGVEVYVPNYFLSISSLDEHWEGDSFESVDDVVKGFFIVGV
jgi:hypothetical protein